MKHSQIPFFRPSIGEDEINEVTECLRSGWLTTGPKAAEFEEAFSSYIGAGVGSVAVNSATAALHLAIEAMGLGPGDEVIVPTLTFTATAEVVRYLGADPVFVDSESDTLCIDADEIEKAISPRTKAVIPVHFAGRPCDMSRLVDIADRRKIHILDDAAHALPASHKGKLIGNCGSHATAFSFYANKTMTTGEGGMLVSTNEDLLARARTMRLHGIDRNVFDRFTDSRASWIYDVVAPGYKYNLTDIAATLGLVQLRKINKFHEIRKSLAARYDEAFSDLPLILPPHAADGDEHSWHLYVVQLKDEAPVSRDDFINSLKDRGIGCSVHYRPLHKMTFWEGYCRGGSFPVADNYFKRCTTLPLFMDMTEPEQDRVIDEVRSILSK